MQCFAYQTPPYGECSKSVESSPRASSNLERNVFNESLVDRMALFLTLNTKTTAKDDYKSIRRFLKELLRRSQCNRRSALLAAAYVENIYQTMGDENGDDFAKCAKKVYLSCLIISNKFLNDKTLSFRTWRLVSGLTPAEMSTMERWCLDKLDYHLYIKDAELYDLEKRMRALSKFK
ncbi:hypothetical protein ZYGR_0I06090 [Zygosaccharomyces rouxii]|uniref:ZYRO0C14454p n=2 Tax=Zygosaccharomyces rouxii TaxID=4956 RepID=C5DU74_ZYGRC|nr:uncharacterized protein ZYRO0C14454g [Zygosaccharomyces rouxii]KAH9201490.1 hypothetical protein LQ764DRAFT_81009 [Zygosaccharomyces rouxii]GAV48312.1 hypothetical protein ZYGR_0I06090 [Zygosaccharomyces rouxii]CAR27335.1 ZYRO0C14454p [Zygosaccharomyces rouxii]